MIPKNQQLVIVPEQVDLQRADDGNFVLVARDLDNAFMVGVVIGPELAKALGEKMIAPSLQVVRHSLPPDLTNGAG